MASWTICTGEYPPDCGGVGDYTSLVAAALAAAGDRVAVCTPHVPGRRPAPAPGVELIELPDRFGAASRAVLARRLDAERSRLLVQYVPNAFGSRGANLPWCRWLLRRARRSGDDVRVMFHEPYFYFEWSRPDRSALAAIQRVMAATLLRAASDVYVSTQAWDRYLRPYASATAAGPVALPIPSSIPRCDRPDEARALRARLLAGRASLLVGHFGTYGAHVAPMIRAALRSLLTSESTVAAVCVGPGSEHFIGGLMAESPALGDRLHAAGRRPAAEAASMLAACDLLIQPYPDGVTTRRTSVMAGLANARPVLTTSGDLTEPVWSDTGAVCLVPASETESLATTARRLIADAPARAALAARGDATYRARFAIEHTIARLRAEVGAAAA